MNYPEDLKYSRTDEWVRLEGDTATVGISDYAQHELGDIVYVELPEEGANVSSGVAFGVVESVKAVSELLSPVAGTVIESNQPVTGDPSIINGSPYGDGWLIKVRVEGDLPGNLMDATAYAQYRSE
jgi:glycine cleavage system H protein